MAVATIDFDRILHGTEASKAAAAQELVESFRSTGFVRLVNTSIPTSAIQQAEDWNHKFFKQEMGTKSKAVNVPSPNPQRGWSYLGAESTARLKNPGRLDLTDEKEHFDVGPPNDTSFPNKWLEDSLPGFQRFSEEFYDACQTLCLQIMAACEIGSPLPRGTLVNKCVPAASELRYNHYPAVSVGKLNQGKTRRGWPHTDFGIITLLFQDSQGGLQYEDRGHPGRFLPLQRLSDDEVAVNISDTFHRWSNGVIAGGVHQVGLPPLSEQQVREGEGLVLPVRKSTVFFFKAHRDEMVGALDSFVDEKRPKKYEDITALEFHKRMTDVLIKNSLTTPVAGS
ncbi:Laccase-2 [Venturia inaequalis]|uniref:Fe2OG dioxygenase domain-containing protein n=1 Tax=Venturia inaequalis TaxID=5025 RepID=A0A8H3Z4K7_VENIN|nr:hypothetical protein EG327_005653 [Venturia inaequalis]RDI86294.1 Laccase-2 [Venturia inaequalis]